MRKIIRNVIAILLCATGAVLLILPALPTNALSQRGDFVMDGATLVEYTGHEADLTLPDNIVTIGKDAFSGNVSLRNVVIPGSVRTIDFAAFENCTNLQTVSIPESVRTLGSSAFSGCSSLYSVNIPRKVKEIGSGTFAGCPSLSSVPVDVNNPNFLCYDGVIYSGDGKEVVQYLAGRPASTYAMPVSVNKINEYAFWGATNLTGVSISGNVTEIPEYAFSNCPGLSTIIIPRSVSKIQAYAFSDCVNLRSAVIPTSVGYIDDLAFYMSNGVEVQFVDPSSTLVSGSVYANGEGTVSVTGTDDANWEPGADNSNSGQVNDSDGIKNGTGALTDPDGFTTETSAPVLIDYEENILPGEMGSTKVVGSNAVLLMSPSMTVKDSYNLNKAELEDGIGETNLKNTSVKDTFSLIRGVLDTYNGTDANIQIPSDVNRIGNRCFYKNENIESVTIPDGVTSIGDFAFARSTLKSVNIPDGVEAIGYAGFYQCRDLTDVSIPDSVETIELGAFFGTPWLYEWQNNNDNDNYLIVGDKILLSYKGEGGNITIPEGVKTIAPGCFLGNTKITGVSVPGSVTTIGEDAFNGCSSLNTVSLSAGLETIEDRAFKNTDLSTLTIPPSVTSIGLGAFDVSDMADLQTVVFTGTELPDVGAKPTASRLSAKDLRSLAFDGIHNAVIRDTADLNSGNIFDPKYLGFRGAVYCMSPSTSDGQNTLHLLRSTMEPDENGIVDIDAHVPIGTADYLMSGVKDDAFDAYRNFSDWCEKPLTDIKIAGNTSPEVESLLDSIGNNAPTVYTEDNAITIRDLRASSTGGPDVAKAHIPGNTDHFIVTVNDDPNAGEAFSAAFINALGQMPTSGIQMFDISMTDGSETIPIKKLNTAKMEITMRVPSNLQGSDDLTILSLNDNGALETVATQTVDVNGEQCVQFVAGHFSPYAICHAASLYAAKPAPEAEEDVEDMEEELMDSAMDLFNIRASNGTLTQSKKPFSIGRIFAIVLIIAGLALLIPNLFNLRKKRNS
ncbi:MAG: leucine-rich repeat domain-containing protein [Lachnospiraceae bacterium]|nr:leucine-rich repeat domain-containing protein [Lachnospiraceae bacterium]